MENLKLILQETIHWIKQHSQQACHFSEKRNDSLLKKFVLELIHYAEIKMASDIHIEPQENFIRIRLRIDGVLSDQFHLPKEILEQLCSQLKILANIDIAQRRLPQDGKFIFHLKNDLKTHIRISTCPTVQGEKIVLRLLKDNKTSLKLDSLGMSAEQGSLFKQAISEPHGLILITGPTGSGKTSTLYSALAHINQVNKNIVTAEDPVEIQISGINQININDKAELSFSSLLRFILRQDPDVIMIGEIRDEETAQIAIQAANTGHLVLATLHTNNCLETLIRIKQMNINQTEAISCLKLIISQRLLRKKCPNCIPNKKPACECTDGYQGRLGIFELLYFNDELKNYFTRNTFYNIRDLIKNHQFKPLSQTAFDYIQQEKTTKEEVKRVLNVC